MFLFISIKKSRPIISLNPVKLFEAIDPKKNKQRVILYKE
jgi:hypothetical protein